VSTIPRSASGLDLQRGSGERSRPGGGHSADYGPPGRHPVYSRWRPRHGELPGRRDHSPL